MTDQGNKKDRIRKMKVMTTFGQGRWDQKFEQTVCFTERDRENQVVNLYPEITYETFEGFGGAITQGAGYVYSQMPESEKKALMEAYFSPKRMYYQFVRIPIDSCDFSTGQYQAVSDPEDTAFETFDFEMPERYILPMLRDAEKAAGKRLPIMLSPWSLPVFMKTNDTREQGGKLRPECYGLWAEYLCRYIEEYRKRGFLVKRLTLQNEPKAVQTWDSCIYTAQEEKVFLRDHMRPAMEKHGLTDIEVFIWDHNKERVYEWMRDILDEETDKMIAGAAFHWYSGDHFEALELCRRLYPDKKLVISESCIELSKFDGDDAIGSAMRLGHEIIGDMNHGMTAFYDWNLLVNEIGGPNYVGNYVLAPFMYDRQNQKLMPQLIAGYFEHFSHYIQPGAVRIASTKFSEQVDAVAWKGPDETIVLIILNKSGENQPVVVRMDDREAAAVLYPMSITTCLIEG